MIDFKKLNDPAERALRKERMRLEDEAREAAFTALVAQRQAAIQSLPLAEAESDVSDSFDSRFMRSMARHAGNYDIVSSTNGGKLANLTPPQIEQLERLLMKHVGRDLASFAVPPVSPAEAAESTAPPADAPGG